MTVLAALSPHCREISLAPYPSRAGIYLLLDGDEVVYVGSSRDVDARIYQHVVNRNKWIHGEPRKTFDRALCLKLPLAVHPHYEGVLIRGFRPKWNGSAPADRGDDVEILDGLGLHHLIVGLRPFGKVHRESMGGAS